MMKIPIALTLLITSPIVLTSPAQAQNRHYNAYGLGMDLAWYCQYRHGASAQLVLREDNAYGWKCQVRGQDLGIEVGEVCRSIYGNGMEAVMGNYDDRSSWYCQQTTAQTRPSPSSQPSNNRPVAF